MISNTIQNKNTALLSNPWRRLTFIILGIFVATLLLALAPQRTLAAQKPGQPADTPDCSLQTTKETAKCNADPDCVKGQDAANCGITRKLKLFINILTGMVGVAIVISVIIGGIQYSMSAGDAQKVAAARSRIANALLALVVFALTYGFLQWVVPGGVL